MSDQEIKTFDAQLDSDLRTLFELEDKGELTTIAERARDEALSEEEFRAAVPEALIRLAATFGSDIVYEYIVRQCSDEAKTAIERARELVRIRLPRLAAHPALVDAVKDLVSESLAEDHPAQGRPGVALNVISNVTRLPCFFPVRQGETELLVPAVRIGLRDRRKRLLLDTTLDWDDILFVAGSMVAILADELERWQSLLERSQLELPDPREMSMKLTRVEAALGRVKKLAPAYGMTLGLKEEDGPVAAEEA